MLSLTGLFLMQFCWVLIIIFAFVGCSELPKHTNGTILLDFSKSPLESNFSHAPKDSIIVSGNFNNWNPTTHPLTKIEQNLFKIHLSEIQQLVYLIL